MNYDDSVNLVCTLIKKNLSTFKAEIVSHYASHNISELGSMFILSTMSKVRPWSLTKCDDEIYIGGEHFIQVVQLAKIINYASHTFPINKLIS